MVLEDVVVVEGGSLEEVLVVAVEEEEEEGLDVVPLVTQSLPRVSKHQGKRRNVYPHIITKQVYLKVDSNLLNLC